MHTTNFYLDLLKDFSHEPTVKQDSALHMVSKFLLSQNFDELFLLKGYAGTGKTSIVGTLVKNSWRHRCATRNFVFRVKNSTKLSKQKSTLSTKETYLRWTR